MVLPLTIWIRKSPKYSLFCESRKTALSPRTADGLKLWLEKFRLYFLNVISSVNNCLKGKEKNFSIKRKEISIRVFKCILSNCNKAGKNWFEIWRKKIFFSEKKKVGSSCHYRHLISFSIKWFPVFCLHLLLLLHWIWYFDPK